jgi:hypothetical protein
MAEAHGQAWAGRKSRARRRRVATLFVDTSGAQPRGWPRRRRCGEASQARGLVSATCDDDVSSAHVILTASGCAQRRWNTLTQRQTTPDSSRLHRCPGLNPAHLSEKPLLRGADRVGDVACGRHGGSRPRHPGRSSARGGSVDVLRRPIHRGGHFKRRQPRQGQGAPRVSPATQWRHHTCRPCRRIGRHGSALREAPCRQSRVGLAATQRRARAQVLRSRAPGGRPARKRSPSRTNYARRAQKRTSCSCHLAQPHA